MGGQEEPWNPLPLLVGNTGPPPPPPPPKPSEPGYWERWEQCVVPSTIDYPNNNRIPDPLGPDKAYGTFPDGRTIIVPNAPVPPGFTRVPPDNGECHQYPANVIGLPPVPGGYRSPNQLANALSTMGYTGEVIPPGRKDKMNGPPVPNSVLQLGDKHVGVAGPDGRIYDWTMAAPNMGIKGELHSSNSVKEFWNATHGGRQPYTGLPLNYWTPPKNPPPPSGKDQPMNIRQPSAGIGSLGPVGY